MDGMDVINTRSFGTIYTRPLYVQQKYKIHGYCVFCLLAFLPLAYAVHGVYVIIKDSHELPSRRTWEKRISSTWQDVVLCPFIFDDVGTKLIRADVYSHWNGYDKADKSRRVQCENLTAGSHQTWMPENVECVKFHTQGRYAQFKNGDMKTNNDDNMGIPQIYFRAVWEAGDNHGYDFSVGTWVGETQIGTVSGYQESTGDVGLITQYDLAPEIIRQGDLWCHKSVLRHANCTLGDGWSLRRLFMGEDKEMLKRSRDHGVDIMHFKQGHWAFRWGDADYDKLNNFACSRSLNVDINRSSPNLYEVQVLIQLFSTNYMIDEIVPLHWRIMAFFGTSFAFTCLMLGLFTTAFSQWPPPRVPEDVKLRPVWSTLGERWKHYFGGQGPAKPLLEEGEGAELSEMSSSDAEPMGDEERSDRH